LVVPLPVGDPIAPRKDSGTLASIVDELPAAFIPREWRTLGIDAAKHIIRILGRGTFVYQSSTTRSCVVYEYRYVAGDHIVRVDVGGGEVVHIFVAAADVVVHGCHVLCLSVRSGEAVS